MKKVLMLASVAGMIDKFNMENIEILQGQGYEVHVGANFEDKSTNSKERIEQFKKELKDKNISYFQIDFSRKIANISQNIKAYKQTKKILIDNKYEFIHCHSPIGGVCGRIAAKITNTKVIYTAHGFHFFKGAPILNWVIYYNIEKVLSYITDSLITINQEDYELAKKKMKAKQIYYIPGIGIDTKKYKQLEVERDKKREELNIPKDYTILLSIGELSKRKNHEVVIRALSKINNPNLLYIIAGRGNLEEYIINLSKKLGVQDKVRLLGFRNDILEICKIADIFCFPSTQEGLPVALMEAMACGLPVVCSNIRGNIDLIKNEYGGYLCNNKDIDEFTNSIDKLIKNKELREKLGKFNINSIRKFDIKLINNQMEEIYINITKTIN